MLHNAGMRMRMGALAIVCFLFALPAAAAAQTVTIKLMSITTVTNQHDTPPKGKGNKGDSIDFKDLLTNRVPQFGKTAGKPVGFDAGTVRYTSDIDQRILVTATFPGVGTLTYEGSLTTRTNGDIVLPITGGTGGFKGARGTVTIGDGEARVPNTYRVTVPGTLSIYGPGVA